MVIFVTFYWVVFVSFQIVVKIGFILTAVSMVYYCGLRNSSILLCTCPYEDRSQVFTLLVEIVWELYHVCLCVHVRSVIYRSQLTGHIPDDHIL